MADPITDAEIKKVLALAEKATPSPWYANGEGKAPHDYAHAVWNCIGHEDSQIMICHRHDDDMGDIISEQQIHNNLAYIAAANPAFVTRLITELLSLRKASHSVSQCCPESERLAKRVEELEARCREANLIDASGNIRVVLGRIPVTKDGAIVGLEADVWYTSMESRKTFRLRTPPTLTGYLEGIPNGPLYEFFAEAEHSTRAAAESFAARGAGESWFCHQCKVEVFSVRCPHCGKSKKERS